MRIASQSRCGFFLINSYTTGLAPAVIKNVLTTALDGLGGVCDAQEIGLPITHGGLVLPCGCTQMVPRSIEFTVIFCIPQ